MSTNKIAVIVLSTVFLTPVILFAGLIAYQEATYVEVVDEEALAKVLDCAEKVATEVHGDSEYFRSSLAKNKEIIEECESWMSVDAPAGMGVQVIAGLYTKRMVKGGNEIIKARPYRR